MNNNDDRTLLLTLLFSGVCTIFIVVLVFTLLFAHPKTTDNRIKILREMSQFSKKQIDQIDGYFEQYEEGLITSDNFKGYLMDKKHLIMMKFWGLVYRMKDLEE